MVFYPNYQILHYIKKLGSSKLLIIPILFVTYIFLFSSNSFATVSIVPNAPQNLGASIFSPTQINLSWITPTSNGGPAVTGYRIDSRIDSGSFTTLVSNTLSTSTSYSDTSVESGHTYSYIVYAINSNGTGSPSNIVTSSVNQGNVPDPPQNLAASVFSANQIDLSWNSPQNSGGSAVTGYRIDFQVDSGTFTTLISNTQSKSTSYSHTTVQSGHTYSYIVYAINSVGTSGPSNTESVSVNEHNTVPSSPLSLNASSASPTSIVLTWNPPLVDSGSAIQGYKIEFKTSDSQYSILVPSTGNADTTYLHTGLVTGTTYTYRVSAINGIGTGTPSNDDSAIPQKTLTPVIVGATVTSPTQVNLSWLPPSETIGQTIEGYRIDQLVDNNLVTLVQDTKTVTSYTVSSLVTNQKYTFEVTALFLGGSQSNPSPGVSATTAIVSPSSQNSLPAGTSFAIGQQSPGPLYTVQFSNSGPQTQYFSPTGSQVNGIWATVSTYVRGAILYFDSGGVTYSKIIDPNSNTLLSFSTPLTVSNIRMSIQDRGYSNDQASISLILTSGSQYYIAPDPPSGLSSTQIAGGNVQLSWTAPSNYGKPPITGYKVEYKVGSSGTWSVFSQNIGLQTIYIPSGLSSGTTYTFRVSAINSVGTSQPSNEQSLTMGYNGSPIPTVNLGTSSGKIFIVNTDTSINYIISGGQVAGANINKGISSLNFQLQGSSSGVLYLNLPRDLIDSKNSDGSDKSFYILVDNSNAQFTETQSGPYRTLAISFPANTKEISIIGTHVVPEFPMALLGLGVGLIPIIFFTRKFAKF